MASTLPVAQSRIVARLAAGDLTDATPDEIRVLLDLVGSVRMVHVGPDKADWKVFRDGVEVDISASTTGGLQEAADAMVAVSPNLAKNLYIIGSGRIDCSTTITFPVLNTQKVYMDFGVINFAGVNFGSIPGIRFQTMLNCDIEMLGKIIYAGSGPCILLKPEGVTEIVTVISDTRFKFTTIDAIGSGSNNSTGIEVDRSNGSVLRVDIEALKIDVQGNTGGKGFVILDNASFGFIDNTIKLKDVRECNVGIQEGVTSGAGIAQNKWEIFQATTKGTTPIGFHLHGQDSDYIYNLNAVTTGATGVKLESAAKRNTVRILSNAAATPIVDNSDNTNMLITGGRIAASVHRNATDQTGIVTATWTKLALTTEVYDTGGQYDAATNYRWTPGVLGMVEITARAAWDAPVDNTKHSISVYKNGASFKQVTMSFSGAGVDQGVPITIKDLVTVSTDYYEIWVWHSMGVNKDVKGESAETYAMFERIN